MLTTNRPSANTIALFLASGSLAAAPASALTLHVPGDYGTIQPALTAASAGDTVLVAPGTYTGPGNRDLDFLGKDLVLLGEGGPAATTIECGGAAHGIALSSGETRAAIIEGLTVRGADNRDAGGGIVLTSNASPTIRGCVVEHNQTDFYGAGIYATSGASPLIENCVVRDNMADGRAGRGGGIFCSSSEAKIVSCLIERNFAHLSGGGIHCWAASPIVRGCIIRNNETDVRAGGVYCKVESSPLLENCIIRDNRSALGGGSYCYVNCAPMFINCVITGNLATETAGGIFCHVTSQPTLINCILRDDEPGEIVLSGAEPVVRHCNVEGGWSGEGNIDVDPRFVSYRGFDLLLAPGSPCVDAGDPVITDAIYDSDPRWPAFYPDAERSDMGAYGGSSNDIWIEGTGF